MQNGMELTGSCEQGMGSIVGANHAVIMGIPSGITSVQFKNASIGWVDLCRHFGSICDENTTLGASGAVVGVDGTGSAGSSRAGTPLFSFFF